MGRRIAIDCETYLIRPGLLTPKLVCVSWARVEEIAGAIACDLLNARDGLAFVRDCLLDPQCTILTQNGVYDFGVFAAEDPGLLPFIFAAYEAGRIRCTKIRQKLIDIANGEAKFYYDERKELRCPTKNDLATLVWRHFGRVLPKAGTYRLRFSELDGVPIVDYPAEAAAYALADAVETLKVFLAQDELIEDDPDAPDEPYPYRTMPNEIPQVQAHWALHLMSCWGLRTDKERAEKLRDFCVKDLERTRKVLLQHKVMRSDGTKDMAVLRARVAACMTARGLAVPVTGAGAISTDRQTLADANDPTCAYCGHDTAEHVGGADEGEAPDERCTHEDCTCDEFGSVLGITDESKRVEKTLSTYVPIVLAGTRWPINPNYDPLKETGRTGSDHPNIQNPPRKGGIRECFIPRGPTYEIVEVPDDYVLQPGEECMD
jgi:hypothetical protein